MWLHADAAYGSGVILSEKYKYKVAHLTIRSVETYEILEKIGEGGKAKKEMPDPVVIL